MPNLLSLAGLCRLMTFSPKPHLTGRDTSKAFGVVSSHHHEEEASERRGEGRKPLWDTKPG